MRPMHNFQEKLKFKILFYNISISSKFSTFEQCLIIEYNFWMDFERIYLAFVYYEVIVSMHVVLFEFWICLLDNQSLGLLTLLEKYFKSSTENASEIKKGW